MKRLVAPSKYLVRYENEVYDEWGDMDIADDMYFEEQFVEEEDYEEDHEEDDKIADEVGTIDWAVALRSEAKVVDNYPSHGTYFYGKPSYDRRRF